VTSLAQTVSCIDGYDPDALHVDKARAAILACITPVSQAESVPVRDALGRVLAQEIVPKINVPAHDNSAMDGYAVSLLGSRKAAEGDRHCTRRQALPRQGR